MFPSIRDRSYEELIKLGASGLMSIVGPGSNKELRQKSMELIVAMLQKNISAFNQVFSDTPKWQSMKLGELMKTLYLKK